MKFKHVFIAAFLTLGLAACADKNLPEKGAGGGDYGAGDRLASVSIQISSNSLGNSFSRADEGPEVDSGTENEQRISSVLLVLFDDQGRKTEIKEFSSLTSDPDENYPTVNTQAGHIIKKVGPFKVKDNSKKVMAVINPTAKLTQAVQDAVDYQSFNVAIADDAEAVAFQDNASSSMPMLNASIVPSKEVVVSPADNQTNKWFVKSQTTDALEGLVDLKTFVGGQPEQNTDIFVDRLLAKVTVAQNTVSNPKDGELYFKVLGFKLQATNKSYFPYSKLVDYNYGESTNLPNNIKNTETDTWYGLYREDPNYSYEWANVATQIPYYSWAGTFGDAGKAQYCLENTMPEGVANPNADNTSQDLQNYNNTTAVMVKVQGYPKALAEELVDISGTDKMKDAAGTDFSTTPTWFTVGVRAYTLHGLDKYLTRIVAKGENATAIEKNIKMAAVKFLNVVLGEDRTKGWTFEQNTQPQTADGTAFDNSETIVGIVSLSNLDEKSINFYSYPDGENQLTEDEALVMVKPYHKGMNFYPIMIKHDNRVAPFKLARWGVVRNNSYTLAIDAIKKAGFGYIPGRPGVNDPNDPEGPKTDGGEKPGDSSPGKGGNGGGGNNPDPQKPTPNQPTPNDKEDVKVIVRLIVRPWTTWTQSVTIE